MGNVILQPGDAHRWENSWLIAMDDGFFKRGFPRSYTAYASSQYSGTTPITVNSKTHQMPNAVVLDNRTGLMWTKNPTDSVGPGSDGKLHWDDHCDLLTTGSQSANFTAGEVLTDQTSNASALLRYVDNTNGILGLSNVQGTFGVGNAINDSGDDGGGSAVVSAYAAGSKEDIWSYMKAANEAQLAGYSDWRVPNIHELISIMYYSHKNGNAKPPTAYFNMPGDTSSIVWTCSHEGPYDAYFVLEDTYADAVVFDTGVFSFGDSSRKCGSLGFSYLVRGPTSAGTRRCLPLRTSSILQCDGDFPCDGFFNNGTTLSWQPTSAFAFDMELILNDGTMDFNQQLVSDMRTGLMWTAATSDDPMPFYDEAGLRKDALEVLRAARDQELAGYDDWRIPNLFEAKTILMGYNHRIYETGWNYPWRNGANPFWTCTPQPNDTDKVFYHVPDGPFFAPGDRVSAAVYVRLCRGGHTEADL